MRNNSIYRISFYPPYKKHAESMEITTIITSTNSTVHLDAMREERYL